EVRELWLRDSGRFENSLAMLEILREIFDVVLVDIAKAEGIFPYSIYARATTNLLVTANEPASVHLLNKKLNQLLDMPGEASNLILVNLLCQKSLTKRDVTDFLYLNQK